MIFRIPAFQIVASKINVITALTLLLFCFSGREVAAGETYRPFATFTAKVEIDIEDGEIDLTASFALGQGSDGIDLASESLSFQATGGTAAYAVTLPAGSFKPDGRGSFGFRGTIDRVAIDASIKPLSPVTFEFQFETAGANLRGIANPVTVSVVVGNDGGRAAFKARIE